MCAWHAVLFVGIQEDTNQDCSAWNAKSTAHLLHGSAIARSCQICQNLHGVLRHILRLQLESGRAGLNTSLLETWDPTRSAETGGVLSPTKTPDVVCSTTPCKDSSCARSCLSANATWGCQLSRYASESDSLSSCRNSCTRSCLSANATWGRQLSRSASESDSLSS